MEICSRKYRSGFLVEYGLVYGILGILVLIAARLLPLSSIPFACPFKAITGIPCPTCGSTRAFMYFAHLDIVGAFSINPLISTLIILGIVLLFYSLSAFFLSPLSLSIKLNRRENRFIRSGVIGVIILNWFYLIFAGI